MNRCESEFRNTNNIITTLFAGGVDCYLLHPENIA